MSRRFSALIGLGIAVGIACGSDHLRRASEEVQVVGGSPTVGQGLPGVSRGDGGLDGSVFGPAAPFQVDVFDQQQVQKVDILWVVDNSRSMQAKQDRLKNNIHSFMQFLQDQSVDYHLGVVSTDTFDPNQSGRLQNKAALPVPWISPDAGANAESHFFTNVGLGELGTGDEKGLLAGMMALTPPLSPPAAADPDTGARNCARLADSGVDCFVRKDAALYTVMVSDEEDSSCSPLGPLKEGCTDPDIRAGNGYGASDYWSRFYAGAKGLTGVSRMAAIVATDSSTHDCAAEFAGFCDATTAACKTGTHPDCTQGTFGGDPCCNAIYGACSSDLFLRAQWCHVRPFNTAGHTTGYEIYGSWDGCKSLGADGGIEFTAYYAPRYTGVAQATGGLATSICDQDYTPALAKLGLQASGLRADFPLSRAPISTSITVLVTPPGGTPAPALPGPSTWSYLRCDGSTPANLIRFTEAARPAGGARISASYDVNVRGLGTCP
jgi:hypothetical protein